MDHTTDFAELLGTMSLAISELSAGSHVYAVVFVLLTSLFSVLMLCRPNESAVGTPAFRKFQRMFLVVYCIMFAGDWLQGPMMYALYSNYGFSRRQCGMLFLSGYASSMLLGTFCGMFADKYGRKRSCLMYAAIYIGSCVLKHFGHFYILLLGM